MKILNQDKDIAVYDNNIEGITVEPHYENPFETEPIISCWEINAHFSKNIVHLGQYESKTRAKEILYDILMTDNKVYIIPKD